MATVAISSTYVEYPIHQSTQCSSCLLYNDNCTRFRHNDQESVQLPKYCKDIRWNRSRELRVLVRRMERLTDERGVAKFRRRMVPSKFCFPRDTIRMPKRAQKTDFRENGTLPSSCLRRKTVSIGDVTSPISVGIVPSKWLMLPLRVVNAASKKKKESNLLLRDILLDRPPYWWLSIPDKLTLSTTG